MSSVKNPKTVVIISDNANVSGGNAQVALSSASALARAGIRCIYFAANGSPPPELAGLRNLEFVVLGQAEAQDDSSRIRGVVRGLWSQAAAKRLDNLLCSLDPSSTIVHVHSFIKALSSSVISAATSRGFRIVMTLHDYFLVCPNGALYNHQKQCICPLRPMSLQCVTTNCDPRSAAEKGYRVIRQLIGKHIGMVPSGISDFVMVSEFSREIFARFIDEPDRIHLVQNPTEASHGARAPIASNSEFTYVGRLSPEKGVRLLIEAARCTNLPTTFVGDGALRRELESAAPPNVTFTGWLSQDDVGLRLMRSRALVLPSLWYEAAPLVIGQAASLGVPVLVSEGTAGERMVADGIAGFKFRRGDVDDLARKMRLLANPEVADNIGRSAYERFWQTRRSTDAHGLQLLKVYETMLSRSRFKVASLPLARDKEQAEPIIASGNSPTSSDRERDANFA